MEDAILSVGIDIGTSTTSMVVSRLLVKNTASCFTVPHVAITDKEIVYRGEIYQTPQAEGNRIDADAVAEILKQEYKRAGITPEMVQTGAVIITGESSRKENARLVTEKMSSLAGEFVVASAGPDLESIIAGKGAGAQKYSKDRACTIANFDVGGGTSNIAVFQNGQLKTRGCYDIGGRLIRVNEGKITYISPRLEHIIGAAGAHVRLNETADIEQLRKITDKMSDVLGESAGILKETKTCRLSKSAESSELGKVGKIDHITFSGGVADYIYHPCDDWFRHGDIGPLLADSIRRSGWVERSGLWEPDETIRATVIGAGAYTTSVSGSTVSFSDETLFPMKNIPAYTVSGEQEAELLAGDGEEYCGSASWFRRECGTENIIFALIHIQNPSYKEVLHLADIMIKASRTLPTDQPLLIICKEDFAKVLGMALIRKLGKQRDVVCLDSIYMMSGDYVDLGKPLMNGMVVPVVVKTLIFG